MLYKVNIALMTEGVELVPLDKEEYSFQVTEGFLVFVRRAFSFTVSSGTLDCCLMGFVCCDSYTLDLLSGKQKQALGRLRPYHNH